MNNDLNARVTLLLALNECLPCGMTRSLILQEVALRRKDVPRDKYPAAIDYLLANGLITAARRNLDAAQLVYTITEEGIRRLEQEGLA